MKVLILSSGLGSVNRGYERFLLELAAQLRANGLPVSCWGSAEAPGVLRVPTMRRDELQQLALGRLHSNARLSSLSSTDLHDWAMHTEEHLFGVAAAACLDEELRSNEPTVVYVKWQAGLVDAGGRSTALLERLIRAGQEGRVSTVVRTDWIYQPVIERLAGHARIVFHTVTPWVTRQLRGVGVPADSIFELPNGVMGEPLRKARSRRSELRDEFRIPQDALVILSVGAFDQELKNFPHVLRELAPFAKDPNIYWLVAGSRGNEPTAWEREAQETFGDRFRPLVDVPFEKMPELYGLADLGVCGSLSETFGLVYAEMQLSGLPFVMHDYEVTRWMTAGLPPALAGASLVDMRAPGALSTAVAQWRTVLRDAKGREALSTILEDFRGMQAKRFSWESIGKEFADRFRAMASSEATGKQSRTSPHPIAADAHAQGVRLAQEGKTAEAIPFLTAALREEETSERWNDWASCQVACQKLDNAGQAYRRAIDLDPRNVEALANFSALLVNQKRHKEAIPLLDRALAIPGGAHRQILQDLLALCKAACGKTPEQAPSGGPRTPCNLAPTGPLRILVVHETLPQTDCGGADVRLMQVLGALRAQGHAVTFVARLGLRRQRYEPPLRAIGIDVYSSDGERLRFLGADFKSDWSIEQVLKAGKFDVAILCEWFWTGPSIPEHYLSTIRRISPDTRIAILSDDRHGLRELRMADLTRRIADIERGKDFQERETEIYRQADIVLAITEEDRAGFLEITPDLQTELLPMVAEKCPKGPGPAKREHLLFLGSFSNLANIDGLRWFFDRVWPKIRERLPEVEIHLAGSSMPDAVRNAGNGIVGLGHIADLAQVFAQHRVFISPIRYGTGIKTKNVAAMSHGIPIVTTTIGAEGMNLHDDATVSIADDPESFAEAVVRLYRDDDLWRTRAKAGREHMLRRFSSERLATQVSRFIDRLRILQPKPFDPNFTPSYQLVERFHPEVLTHQPGIERPGVRLVAYVHMGESSLDQGRVAEALSQFRHAFHYVRGTVPNVSIFGRLLRGMERCYRELGDSESAARCAPDSPAVPEDARLPVTATENRGSISEAPSQESVTEQLSEALS
jgi:glycosyltransferase involved in cell wall biosynthesis